MRIFSSYFCLLAAVSLLAAPCNAANQSAKATKGKVTPVKKPVQTKDDAARAFGESLLLQMTEPQKKSVPVTKTTAAEPKHFLQGLVLHNEVSDQLERVGIFVALRMGKKRALVVQRIRPGSSAYYEGLTDGDEIRSIGQGKGTLIIVFDRNGKKYSVKVACPPGYELSAQEIRDFLAQNPKIMTTAKGDTKAVKSNVKPVQVVTIDSSPQNSKTGPIDEKLAPYDIQIIVNSKQDAKSKELQWCKFQLKDLVSKIQKRGRQVGLAAMTEKDYVEIDNCTPELVDSALAAAPPKGRIETRVALLARMENKIANYATTQKPLLFVVFADGSGDVSQSNVTTELNSMVAKQPQPNRITVAHFSLTDAPKDIGSAEAATVSKTTGDSVKTKGFRELSETGLAQALADVVAPPRPDDTQVDEVELSPVDPGDGADAGKKQAGAEGSPAQK